MSKSLVIVESPAKAKTINKYLGSEFVVKSSVGHIRDLPVSGSGNNTDPAERAKEAAKTRAMSPEKKAAHKQKKAREQLIARMGVDPEHGWKARYEILPGKEKVVAELKKLAKNADTIYLATDLDREGEAIAWHLREAIGGDDSRYRRVVFNEITKKAINEAFRIPAIWTCVMSKHSRRDVFLTVWSGLWCRRCCGARSPEACLPDVCNRLQCA